jgi:hypothetical protein
MVSIPVYVDPRIDEKDRASMAGMPAPAPKPAADPSTMKGRAPGWAQQDRSDQFKKLTTTGMLSGLGMGFGGSSFDSQFGAAMNFASQLGAFRANTDRMRGYSDVNRSITDELAIGPSLRGYTEEEIEAGAAAAGIPVEGAPEAAPPSVGMVDARPAAPGYGFALEDSDLFRPVRLRASVSKMSTPELTFAAGTAKVPGKGDGTKDTVKAKLAPGEAVLNKAAAEGMGRGLIAALNMAGARKMGMV